MNLEQLTGRSARLKQELLTAYGTSPRNSGRIARLTDELTSTEREIAAIIASHPDDADDRRHAA